MIIYKNLFTQNLLLLEIGGEIPFETDSRLRVIIDNKNGKRIFEQNYTPFKSSWIPFTEKRDFLLKITIEKTSDFKKDDLAKVFLFIETELNSGDWKPYDSQLIKLGDNEAVSKPEKTVSDYVEDIFNGLKWVPVVIAGGLVLYLIFKKETEK